MKYLVICFVLFTAALYPTDHTFFEAEDRPGDDGSAIVLTWDLQSTNAAHIMIYRYKEEIEFPVVQTDRLRGRYTDDTAISPNEEYQYLLTYYDEKNNELGTVESYGIATASWFDTTKLPLLLISIVVAAAIIFFIYSAKQGKELYIRPISGLESMDEAIGRATEMGKPVLFIPGTLDLDNMQTIAGLTILGRLAQKTAEYDTDLIVPVCRSMVLSTAKEVVKEAYAKAGRPDAFKDSSVFYLTDDQFGFVAGVDGIIIRDKPAANFFLGAFYAESLILAETGFASGSMQTAGTAQPSQLPFFVATCDYTLIGEELFAASAYLSRDPHQLGSLKGQDIGKAIFLSVLVVGIILEIVGISFLKDFLSL